MSSVGERGVDLELIEGYADNFRAMGNPLRLAILFILYASVFLYGEHCLTFRQIHDILGFPNKRRPISSLQHHMSVLLENNFIERIPHQEKRGKSKVKTLYQVADKGREFLTTFGMQEKIKEIVQGGLVS